MNVSSTIPSESALLCELRLDVFRLVLEYSSSTNCSKQLNQIFAQSSAGTVSGARRAQAPIVPPAAHATLDNLHSSSMELSLKTTSPESYEEIKTLIAREYTQPITSQLLHAWRANSLSLKVRTSTCLSSFFLSIQSGIFFSGAVVLTKNSHSHAARVPPRKDIACPPCRLIPCHWRARSASSAKCGAICKISNSTSALRGASSDASTCRTFIVSWWKSRQQRSGGKHTCHREVLQRRIRLWGSMCLPFRLLPPYRRLLWCLGLPLPC